jgi:hypothetical protein
VNRIYPYGYKINKYILNYTISGVVLIISAKYSPIGYKFPITPRMDAETLFAVFPEFQA